MALIDLPNQILVTVRASASEHEMYVLKYFSKAISDRT